MTDKLLKHTQSGPHRMTLAQMGEQFKEMETRILADAKIIKAAEELDRIASAVWLTMGQTKLSDELMAASDAYRAAVSERDT